MADSVATQILTCECGAKVRVPADGPARAFRCPKCKAVLTTPAAPAGGAAGADSGPPPIPNATTADSPTNRSDAVVLSSRPLSAGESVVCPICQTAVAAGEEVVVCESCDQLHHRDCWAEIGGCGTYGCAQAPAIDKSEETAAPPLSAWGDTKKCPACGEVIKSIALRCRYCGTNFNSVDPLSLADLHRHVADTEQLETVKKWAIGLFVVSIIGFFAPLMLVISLVYVTQKRDQLAKSGPLFVIMGWAAVGLSGLYSLLMLAFFLVSS